MVIRKIPDRLGSIEQLDAALHQSLFDLSDLLEEPVG
jgi:hypothetical protein